MHFSLLTLGFLACLSAYVNSLQDVSQVRFLLYYSKTFKNLFVTLDANNPTSLQTTRYISNKPTKFLCHGYTALFTYDFPQQTKNAYLSLSSSYNVIVIDWDAYSGLPYNTSASYVPDVGRSIANLINALIAGGRATLSDFHFIGHSLGGQVGAFITPNLGNGKVLPRVTGLDPARPGFSSAGTSSRLDASDATFVDIIRTSAGINNSKVTVPEAPVGTADFYPNGGLYQKGCSNSTLIDNLCSHDRSYEYFTESITTSKGFVAYKCSSYADFKGSCSKSNPAVMGEFVSQSITGSYYLDTASTSPYALG